MGQILALAILIPLGMAAQTATQSPCPPPPHALFSGQLSDLERSCGAAPRDEVPEGT